MPPTSGVRTSGARWRCWEFQASAPPHLVYFKLESQEYVVVHVHEVLSLGPLGAELESLHQSLKNIYGMKRTSARGRCAKSSTEIGWCRHTRDIPADVMPDQ